MSPGLTREQLVVDGRCRQLRRLLPGARLQPLLIGSAHNPLEEIAQALAGQRIETLHLVAHGRPGGFQLGGQWIDRQALLANAACLARWNVRRLALWSCSLGQDRGFMAVLAELTGAEIWSSDQPLGDGLPWRLDPFAVAGRGRSGFSRCDEPQPPFAAAALAAWPHRMECRAEFAGLLISQPFKVQGTRVEQNTITLAAETAQPSPDPGSVQFEETGRKGNNLQGVITYTQAGQTFSIAGEISRQYKKEGGSNKDVESYYFVPDAAARGGEAVAYFLVTYSQAGTTDNLSLFQPGETYKTSSDFKASDCEGIAKASRAVTPQDSAQPDTGPGQSDGGGQDHGSSGQSDGGGKDHGSSGQSEGGGKDHGSPGQSEGGGKDHGSPGQSDGGGKDHGSSGQSEGGGKDHGSPGQSEGGGKDHGSSGQSDGGGKDHGSSGQSDGGGKDHGSSGQSEGGGKDHGSSGQSEGGGKDHGSPGQRCPEPFATELAGVLVSDPLLIQGTRVQQNEITLAANQPSPEPGTIFFRQTGSAGNNLIGRLFYSEAGREVEVEGELSRQVKGIDGKPQGVEAYYFVAKDLDVAYLMVTYTQDGSKDNLAYFTPGGTYKTSSDFQCQSFFSQAVLGQLEDPGDPKPQRFEIPPDGVTPPDDQGNPPGGGTIEQQITVVDPDGDILPEDSYSVKEDPTGDGITVDLKDANPDRPGDQPFKDGTYIVRFQDEELGGIVVESDALRKALGGPCVEALIQARAGRSSRNSGKKADKLTGAPSNRLEALSRSGAVDELTGTPGPDVYHLGDASSAYLADHGVRDYVRIAGFAADDSLLLHGRPSDYDQSGPLIVDGRSGYGLSFRGDLIALIQADRAGGFADSSALNAMQIHYI